MRRSRAGNLFTPRFHGIVAAVLVLASGPGLVIAADVGSRAEHTTIRAHTATGRAAPQVDPFALVSSDRLLEVLEDLTEIGQHSGWRTCGSSGDRQALDFVENQLARHYLLRARGLEVHRQSFRTIAGVEIHTAWLEITVGSSTTEVPADAIAGHPYSLEYTRLYDSDGDLTDLDPDPVSANGRVRVFIDLSAMQSLNPGELAGRIAVVDFALIDTAILGSSEASNRLSKVFEASPAGVLAVTSDSLEAGESHGSFALDSSVFSYFQRDPPIPVLVARLEDMAAAGISSIADLENITRARMTWDEDIVSPGQSANIIARIPGADSSKATVLSAHLDSPNCPGALDNGSGSAALLEIARVLDRSHAIPPVDVYLVWFGCEERGLFGSPTFAATHQELLDRTLGMIELDALARPLNGLADPVNLESWSYSRLGDDTLPLPEFLRDQASARGINALTWDFHDLLSDITGFVPYDVPNALLDNLDIESGYLIGPVHYTAHWHTPYDTIEQARAEATQFAQLTRVLLSAALDTGVLQPNLRVTPAPSARVVFVASHTEAVHMAPYLCLDLGTIIAWEGLDLDLVPYGQALTGDELENAAMVVVLPVHDYPNELADVDLYDEAWTPAEISTLEAYVDGGGFLVLTNSASRLGPFARAREANEDAADLNLLAREFGIQYSAPVAGSEAAVVGSHELVAGVDTLTMVTDNAIGLMGTGGSGLTLAAINDDPVMVLVQHGTNGGEVLALGDLGMLVSQGGQPTNFTFWQNLVRYAASR